MKYRKRTAKEIQASKKALRKIIESEEDPFIARIAQAVEDGITWATEATTWESPHKEIPSYADCLKTDLRDPRFKMWSRRLNGK